MNSPKVEILIINWNGIDDTRECLESLQKISYPNFHITVIDNFSNNNEGRQLEKEYSKFARVIHSIENKGFVGGNNLGFQTLLYTEFEPDYFLLLNNDTIVDPYFLHILIKETEKESCIGMAGSAIYNYGNTTIQSLGFKINAYTGSSTPLYHQNKEDQLPKESFVASAVSGCCFLVKTSVIKKIGLLDPEYFSYYEETDFCARAHKSGYTTIAVPMAKIYHKGGASAKKISGFEEFQLSRNRLVFVKKNSNFLQKLTCLISVTFFFLPLRVAVLLVKKSPTLLGPLFKGYSVGIHIFFSGNKNSI